MSTTIIIPSSCDEHDFTAILCRVAVGRWEVAGVYCRDCNESYWLHKEGQA